MKLSVSKVKAFKACRRMYELRYVENLHPVRVAESLEIGKNYHKLIEDLNNGEGLPDDDFSKERAMAEAYRKYIFPLIHVTEAEKYLEYDLDDGDILRGYADAISDDGHVVEYKTTGLSSIEEYEYNLQWDEQTLAYMLMTGHRKVWYVICRKPTIRQKQTESDEEFYNRMVAWYDDEPDSKIRILELTATDAEISDYLLELNAIKGTMKEAEIDHNFYKNTCHCMQYGRRCEYAPVCKFYDPNSEYIDFYKEAET